MQNDSKCQSKINQQQNRRSRECHFQNDIITVNLLKFRELFARYLAKTNSSIMDQQKLTYLLMQSKINSGQNNKSNLSRQLFSREKQLLRELSNFNKIKENNERILKNKIKQLQQKLWTTDEKQYKQSKKVQFEIQLGILRLSLNNKESDIFELNGLIVELQNKIQDLEIIINKLARQKQQLVHRIYDLQEFSKQSDSAAMGLKVRTQSRETQTIGENSHGNNGNLSYLSIEQVLDLKLWNLAASGGQNKGETQYNETIRSLEESNSQLRRQLLQLHVYVQEQDERYSKNIVFLEDKIKKLTYFNKYNSRRTSMSSLSQSTGFFTPRKMMSIDESQIIKPDTNQTIKLADLKIHLELSNHQLGRQQIARRINLISPSQEKEDSFTVQQQ